MKSINLLVIILVITTILFTVNTYKMSNQLSQKSEIIDSLNYELLACDTENVVLGTVLNQIKEYDSTVFNNAINKLMDEN
jgi:hypothetical protein